MSSVSAKARRSHRLQPDDHPADGHLTHRHQLYVLTKDDFRRRSGRYELRETHPHTLADPAAK
jgi:hypothetical protein